jgi:hypothetical protein
VSSQGAWIMPALCIYNACMAVTVTVRDVPEDVRDALTRAAQTRGQSLQAFLLGVLKQQAAFSRNAELVAEVAEDLAGGGAQADVPDAAALLEQVRPEAARSTKGRRGSRSAA